MEGKGNNNGGTTFAGCRETEDVSYWGWKNESLSWNWKGLEGKPVKVNVYSRAPKVRLYLNNELLGEQEVSKKDYTATFIVNYQPGELKAVAIYDNSESSCAILRTTGAPVQIRLIADRKVIKADRDDLAYVTVELIDKEGKVVPDADMKVTLSAVGMVLSGDLGMHVLQIWKVSVPYHLKLLKVKQWLYCNRMEMQVR